MDNYCIKRILENEFEPFYNMVAEIEIGSMFDPNNEKHLKWIKNKIKIRFASETNFFAIYSSNNDVIGIAGVRVEARLDGVPYLGRNSELTDIVILEEYRNKGYGSNLLKYIEKYAKEKGAYCIYAATAAFDFETVCFYGKNNFIPIATLVDVNGPNEEGALYMRKIL